MTILVIALLHALPVYLLAVLSRNKWVLWGTAAGSMCLAVYAGNDKYVVYDALAIAIAMALAWPATKSLPAEHTNWLAGAAGWVLGLAGAAALLYGAVFVVERVEHSRQLKQLEVEQQKEIAALYTMPIIALADKCMEHTASLKGPIRYVPGPSMEEVCGAYDARMKPHVQRAEQLMTRYRGEDTPEYIRRQITDDCNNHRNLPTAKREQDPAMELICEDYIRAVAARNTSINRALRPGS